MAVSKNARPVSTETVAFGLPRPNYTSPEPEEDIPGENPRMTLAGNPLEEGHGTGEESPDDLPSSDMPRSRGPPRSD